MKIEIPELCLVALIGASGSGKSSFAKTYFKPTEVLSSDYFRSLLSDDETDQSVTTAAFESLYFVAGKRLDNGRLTVIDATNVQKHARKKIIELARSQNVFAAAIVLDMPAPICIERNKQRPNRSFGPKVVQNQVRELQTSLRNLKKEGFRYVYLLNSPEEVSNTEVARTKLWSDKRDESGPFDIIGDIHGCYDELCELLSKLGYDVDPDDARAQATEGRRAIFLGDLCDRGPHNARVLRLVMNMVKSGHALCVPGNHDAKLLRKLRGADVTISHGLDRTLAELNNESPQFIAEVVQFIDSLVSHYVLDGGRLVVAHAGLSETLQGRSSGKVRDFCLYGDTTGETDEYGLPVRLNWAEEYRGRALVVYGHSPSENVRSINNTICIDTGCVFGGRLSAYRYPERELVDVPAKKEYYSPAKPLNASMREGELDIADIMGVRHIQTRLYRDISLSEEQSALTLETMSRFSVDPRWLIYLPPTMSPCGTSSLESFLEYPTEAFDYYRKRGTTTVICEEKHMGSRAIIVLCRNTETARNRFSIVDPSLGVTQPLPSAGSAPGIIYTRTGRPFFDRPEAAHEQAILNRLSAVLERSGFWETFATDWVCLDTELMPWSAKARALILEQYAAVGAAGSHGLAYSITALQAVSGIDAHIPSLEAVPPPMQSASATPSDMDINAILQDYKNRLECIERYRDAYRRYCWPVTSVDDYRIAPFHILATEGRVWNNETHLHHLAIIRDYIAGIDPIFIATNHLAVDLNNEASVAAGIDWWRNLTDAGGEGMVVKPLDFIPMEKNRLIQPAVKCRGREYLRIIYGPEYAMPASLERLRKRSLRKKQDLALAEFSLGMESLERFVKKEPFHRVHECVFAVLALENEEVDPRL